MSENLRPSAPSSLPERCDVFGCPISLTTVDEVVSWVLAPPRSEGLTVAIANVHSVMTARRQPTMAQIFEEADIATPDGVPLVWALRASGHHAVRVTGIDVMTESIDKGREHGVRHFFYGSTEIVLQDMVAELNRRYGDFSMAGSISPPFRGLDDDELDEHLETIRASGAGVVWVGLGMPKQERWMARVRHQLPGVALVGVGAAFDWLAGSVPIAPEWMRERGLEWLFRLALEPGRMWRRYAYNNPAFLLLLAGRRLGRSIGRRHEHR